MPAGNENLHASRRNRTDEFYTQLSMVENELAHYQDLFHGKSILCNCDDPWESQFFKYFAMNFNHLHLRKLIATSYVASPIAYQQLSLLDLITPAPSSRTPTPRNRPPYKLEVTEVSDVNGDGRVDLDDVEWLVHHRENTLTRLSGDGDFRSDEGIRMMRECDIVCTNPPFSLFKPFMQQLVDLNKNFLIIGNQNAAFFKEIFPLIQSGKIWLGYTSGHFWFRIPDYYEERGTDFKVDAQGIKWRRIGNICWFTNLPVNRRHEPLPLFRHYSPEQYPKYDTFDAIDVSAKEKIPVDYYGVMGVPMSFLTVHCPEQFEIVGEFKHGSDGPFDLAKPIVNGSEKYMRVAIRRIRDMEV